MTAQVKPHTSILFDTISNMVFLRRFKLACDSNGAHKGASMCLSHFFINITTSAVLNARLSAEVKQGNTEGRVTKH